MIMYEQDPDVIRWGLHLLHGDPFPNSGYCGTATQNDTCFYDREYAREGNFGTDHTTVENDEIIAHALQEEFSQLAVAEASGLPHASEEHVEASVLAQDWYGSTMSNFISGNEGEHEGGDDMASSSCSSPEVKFYEGEEWLLELADDFSTLDEVGKRLNQVASTPHKPRINREIPSADEAISDHERLLERLQLYELVERKVQGDGNCQFRALSDQFYRTSEHHKFVRQQITNQLKSCPEIYEGYVPMAYDEYLNKMSSTGEWGDHVTLQAAADSYGVKIFVITSFKDTCYIEIQPCELKSKRVIFLSFWAEVHYNSIYPAGELPAPETKKKKRWWQFGNRH
uniref:ubiquitinyl hydrolase 1 n=1 Tax=Anthurium amnicola TaxID=1678845 RepID=A0A1D1Y089_9ARAE